MSISVAIVIPVYREGSYIEKTLHSIEKSVQYSMAKYWIPQVVVVVNNPVGISEEFRKDNHQIILNLGDVKQELSYPLHILDYTEPGLSNGVGEARRIGMGYAIAKFLNDPKDRLVCLDADCLVDSNYVETLFRHSMKGSAFTIYFEHALDSEFMIFYELYLRYLRWGLELAQTPYGFYSVGSCMGTTVENYNKVGGMVSKSATEDFHFLNKLRKHGPVDYWTDTTIHPSSRLSERVTLGTGYFLTHARRDFDATLRKLMIPSVEDFEMFQAIQRIFHEYDGVTSMRDRFEKLNLVALYNDLHERKVIEKIDRIFQTTSTPENYKSRLLEVVDGLETLRILRFVSQGHQKTMTKATFMDMANQLWKTNLTAHDLLVEIRRREKVSL